MLPGKLNNDPIETHFFLMRSTSGANEALDVKFFRQNSRIALMKNIVSLCHHSDRSFDREQHEQFYENVNENINSYKTVLFEQSKKGTVQYNMHQKQGPIVRSC